MCPTATQNSLEELFGPTLHLNSGTLELSFPTAFQRLHVSFYRSKLTSWMAAQEEDYRCVCCHPFTLVPITSAVCLGQVVQSPHKCCISASIQSHSPKQQKGQSMVPGQHVPGRERDLVSSETQQKKARA